MAIKFKGFDPVTKAKLAEEKFRLTEQGITTVPLPEEKKKEEPTVLPPSPILGKEVPKELEAGVIKAGEDIKALQERIATEGITGLDKEKLPDIGIEEAEEAPLVVDSQQARREKLEAEVKADVTGGLARPELPSYEADFEALHSAQGMSALENQINSIDQEMRDLEAALRQGLYKEEGRLAPMDIIGGRQKELKRQAQEQMDELTRRRQTLVDQYNTKVGVVNSIMKFKEMDYNAANADYNTAFSQAIQIQNLIEGRLSKEAQIANQQRDDARANLSILQKYATDAGFSWSELESNMQGQIENLELQSGLPLGITEAFMNANPGMKVDYTTQSYDAQGNQIVSFFSYNNGDPKLIKSIGTGGIKQLSPTQTEQSAVDLMKSDLMAGRGEDLYVSPDYYKEGKQLWRDSGRDPIDYDKEFKMFANPSHIEDYDLEEEELALPESIQQLKDKLGYSRKDAKDYIIVQLEKQYGKGNVPKAVMDSVEDALVKTYGRTFWQTLLPGGK